MWTRAWVAMSIETTYRVFQLATGAGIWNSWSVDREDLEYNKGLVDELLPWGRNLNRIGVAICVILTILCIKWRFLARAFFHIIMIQMCLLDMIPVDPCFNTDTSRMTYRLLFTLLYACDLKSGIITLVVT